jgi:hypothetical protein
LKMRRRFIRSELSFYPNLIMAKLAKLSGSQQVDNHVAKLDPLLRQIVERIRKIVLDTDAEIGEHLKWNSPSFYYTGQMKDFDPKEYGRDILVLNLHRGRVLIVFPSAAKLNENYGILEGDYTDGRRTVTIKDLPDLSLKQIALQTVIKKWLASIDK